MKKNVLNTYSRNSAEYVVLHGLLRKSRKCKPSLSFLGVKNPNEAFALAEQLAIFHSKNKVETLPVNVQTFSTLSKVMAKNSEGKLKFVYREEDNSKKKDHESSHFLKYKGERLGRDSEVYAFMAIISAEQALPDFLEIVISLSVECPDSYRIGFSFMKELGKKVYDEELIQGWNRIFN